MKDESIQSLFCGGHFSMILKKNLEIWVFGQNDFVCSHFVSLLSKVFTSLFFILKGQLGIGNIKNQNKPVLLMKDEKISQICLGGNHSMILKENGDLLSFQSPCLSSVVVALCSAAVFLQAPTLKKLANVFV